MEIRKVSANFLVTFAFIVAVSCSYQPKLNINPGLFSQTVEPVPFKVGLFFEQDYCQYTFTKMRYADSYEFQIGPILCDYTERMFRTLFSDVIILESLETDNTQQELNVIVIPQLMSCDIVLPGVAWQTLEALVTIKYTFKKPDDGKTLWLDTFQGNWSGKLGIAFVMNKNIRKAMQHAIEDHFLKALVGISSSNFWQ
jgi:hypothetical protein